MLFALNTWEDRVTSASFIRLYFNKWMKTDPIGVHCIAMQIHQFSVLLLFYKAQHFGNMYVF